MYSKLQNLKNLLRTGEDEIFKLVESLDTELKNPSITPERRVQIERVLIELNKT